MTNKAKILLTIFIISLMLSSGCALLRLPVQIVGGTLNGVGKIVGGALKIIDKLPKPPPWVFL
ncbi:MAG: hypothetical protein ABH872_02620 [Candidatus Omnitrophota bacterium]